MVKRLGDEYENYKEKHHLTTKFIDTIPFSMWLKDLDGKYVFVNKEFEIEAGLKREDILNKTDYDILSKEEADMYKKDDDIVIETRQSVHRYYNLGEKCVKTTKNPFFNDEGELLGTTGISEDVTEKNNLIKELSKLSITDGDTGLLNKDYFNKKIKELDTPLNYPLSLILGDINDLKLINDTLGHIEGDNLIHNVCSVLKKSCRKDDLIFRIGGDEIAILMPNTSEEIARKVEFRIIENCKRIDSNKIPCSISLGVACKKSTDENMENIIKRADKEIYKQKLILKNEASVIQKLDDIINILENKNIECKIHSKNVLKCAQIMGKELKLSKSEMYDLELVARYHHIGMISMTDEDISEIFIMSNEYKFNKIVSSNVEASFRIMQLNQQYYKIARAILTHHENWDGSGFPFGLRGENISIYSRIIHVCDDYVLEMIRGMHVGVNNPIQKSINKILFGSGTKYDPKIVEIFKQNLEIIKNIDY